MKIVLCNYSLGHGGAERVLTNLSSEWAELGWDVTVVTLTSNANDFYRLHEGVRRIALDLTKNPGAFISANARAKKLTDKLRAGQSLVAAAIEQLHARGVNDDEIRRQSPELVPRVRISGILVAMRPKSNSSRPSMMQRLKAI